MSDKHKILVCGDVEGRFDTLFKKVETIAKKSGRFDMLLCVGNFFGINNKELIPYKLGNKKVPLPTYILGPNKEEHVTEYPDESGISLDICPNLHYLGKRGIYSVSKGIRVAYISGISDEESKPWTYSVKEINELCDACVKGNPSFRGVDILLTSQWPSNIIANDTKQVNLTVNCPSDMVSYLCMKLKPRYTISGLEGVYYERPPFRCPNLGDHDNTMEITTRFIGLARVGNRNKDKWIYAMNLTPLDKMKISELMQKTTDETVCPFSFHDLENRIFKTNKKRAGPNQYFYDMEAPMDGKEKKQKTKKPRIEFDQNKCWFCLSSPSVEKHLIVAVGTSSYLALAKGGMVDEHFLICPIEHYRSSIGQPSDVQEEINKFKETLRNFYKRKNKVAVFFERNYKSSHMQLQAVPIPVNANRELKDIFIEESDAQGFKLETLESHNRLDQVIPPNVPFFSVELPEGVILYTKIQGNTNFPLNFAREVLASGPILNMRERIDWKECTLQKDEEELLVKRLRKEFEPFDFNE